MEFDPSRHWEFDGFVLDQHVGQLQRAGQNLQIRPKALALLTYFLSNPGRVLDKSILMDAVWPEVTVSDDSLTQCVSELRRLLGPSASRVRTLPRRGYLFVSDGVETSETTTDTAAPDAVARPSVLVLPFVTYDPADRIADGLAEEISAGLGRFRQIFVVAHDSARALCDAQLDDFAVARTLSVRYVVSGSARRSGARLRVTARLVEVNSGTELWGDHFDSVDTEIFTLHDQVTQNILGAMVPRMETAEISRVCRKPPESLEAYDICLAAHAAIRRMTPDGNRLALALADQALALEPDYGLAAGLAAWAYTLRVAHGWYEDFGAEARRGIELAHLAITSGARAGDAAALATGGYALAFLDGSLEEGLAAIEEGIRINPGDARAYVFAGWVLGYLGRATEAISMFQTALKLSPRDPELFRLQAGMAFGHLLNGDMSSAIAAGRAALQHHPDFSPTHRALAAALALSGRTEEAKRVVAELLRLVPNLTVSKFGEQSLFRYSGQMDRILEGLRQAGLPP
ncbi:winged helix-turn-helix domain-containing protein (plasmid) [Salipiger sp. H15]|uniref:Winged helix-turn-helix domain-containing protein n=1 Tax=Alloyangia sp. H15 TaxID=3029062 RepID=A0AAU8AU56_9RHOB